MKAEEFDRFRKFYHRLTLDEIKKFYYKIHGEYPCQDHYDPESAISFLGACNPLKVIEVGGGNGRLAGRVLEVMPSMELWHNYELDAWKAENQDKRYEMRVPNRFVWECELMPYDTLVMSHSMEHMAPDNVRALLGRLPHLAHVYVDYPPMPPGGWAGTTCAHVNPMDLGGVIGFMASLGFIGHRLGVSAAGFHHDS